MNTLYRCLKGIFICFFIIGIILTVTSCSLAQLSRETTQYISYIGKDNFVRVYESCEDEISATAFSDRLPKELSVPITKKRLTPSKKRECFHVELKEYKIVGWVMGKIEGKVDKKTEFELSEPTRKPRPSGICHKFINSKRSTNFDVKGPSWGFYDNIYPRFLAQCNEKGRAVECFYTCDNYKWGNVGDTYKMTYNTNALFVKAMFDKSTRKSHPFECYKDYMAPISVGKKELSLKDLTINDENILARGIPIAVKKSIGGILELSLPPIIKVASTVEASSSEKLFTARIVVIGSRHALSLANLGQWDGDWGGNALDKWLEKEIYWIEVKKNSLLASGPKFLSFQTLSRYAKRDASIVSSLQGSTFFQALSDFFPQFLSDNSLTTVDYLVILKDNWDIGKPEGIEDLITQLKTLNIQNRFDILSTKTRTDAEVWFKALTNGVDGRYFESEDSDNLNNIRNITSIADRINGKVRVTYRPRLGDKGVTSTISGTPSDGIFIKENDPTFKIFNLTPLNFAETMLDFVRILKCLAQNPTVNSEQALEQYLVDLNLRYDSSEFDTVPLSQFFESWFVGFKIPSSSPLANKSLMEIIITAREEEGEVQSTLDKIEDSLIRLIEHAKKHHERWCQIYEVPVDIFILP